MLHHGADRGAVRPRLLRCLLIDEEAKPNVRLRLQTYRLVGPDGPCPSVTSEMPKASEVGSAQRANLAPT